MPRIVLGLTLSLASWASIAAAQNAPASPASSESASSHATAAEDEKSIRQNIDTYVAAYLNKDAEALAAFWSESGRFVSPLTGETISGRENIRNDYAATFVDAEDIALEVEIESLRFVTEDVAIEEGIATVVYPGELPSESSYQVVHVKQDGEWLIDSLRETLLPAPAAPGTTDDDEAQANPVAELKELEWMIGDWIDEDENSAIYFSCTWGMGMNFIKREFEVVIEDRIEMEGIEVIGWDPAEKTWRSWVFDSEGGFGSAVWTREGDSWTKRLTGTTRSGQKAYAVQTISRVDDDTYQWRAHGRELDGELRPNIETITVKRLSEDP